MSFNMKYIDADLLRKKIEKSKYIIEPMFAKGDDCYYEGEYDGYNNILDIIDSLQQKQPKQKKNCNDCPHCVDRKDQFGWHFKGCFGGPYNGKFIAEIDECPLQQEQPEVDLEKEIERVVEQYNSLANGSRVMKPSGIEKIARHFYELGLNARKEESK